MSVPSFQDYLVTQSDFNRTIREFLRNIYRIYQAQDDLILVVKGTRATNAILDYLSEQRSYIKDLRLKESDWDMEFYFNPSLSSSQFNELQQRLLREMIDWVRELRARLERNILETLRNFVAQYGFRIRPERDYFFGEPGNEHSFFIRHIQGNNFDLLRLMATAIKGEDEQSIEILDVAFVKQSEPDLQFKWDKLNQYNVYVIDGIPYFSLNYQYYEIMKMLRQDIIPGYEELLRAEEANNREGITQGIARLHRIPKLPKDLEKKKIFESLLCQLELYDEDTNLTEKYCRISQPENYRCVDIGSLRELSKEDLIRELERRLEIPHYQLNYLKKIELCRVYGYLRYYEINFPNNDQVERMLDKLKQELQLYLERNYQDLKLDRSTEDIDRILYLNDIYNMAGRALPFTLYRDIMTYLATDIFDEILITWLVRVTTLFEAENILIYVYGASAMYLDFLRQKTIVETIPEEIKVSDWDIGIIRRTDIPYQQYINIVNGILREELPRLIRSMMQVLAWKEKIIQERFRGYGVFELNSPSITVSDVIETENSSLYRIIPNIRIGLNGTNVNVNSNIVDLSIFSDVLSDPSTLLQYEDGIYYLNRDAIYRSYERALRSDTGKKHIYMQRLELLKKYRR